MEKIKSKLMILVFADDNDDSVSSKMVDSIQNAVADEAIIICHTIKDLDQKCRKLPREIDVAVLMPQNNMELETICNIAGLLENIRVLLVLPNRDPETLSKAWLLNPTYIEFIDTDFFDLLAVLENICKKIKIDKLKSQ